MANYPKYTLTGKTPASTYEHIVQYNVESASFVDGFGNDLPPFKITASVSGTSSYAVSASWAPDQTVSVVSASWASQSLSSSHVLGNAVSGPVLESVNAVNADTASWVANLYPQVEQVSASWASQSLSASWAPGDGSGTNLYTGSTYEITSSWAVSASWAPFTQVEQVSASWASQSLSASWAPSTQVEQVSASWASQSLSASWAPFTQVEQISASWASSSLSASYLTPTNDYEIRNLSVSNSISASSLILTSPFSTALQVGTSLPIYLSQGWPTVGFNTYWDTSWKFGPGSSNNWAAFQNLNVTNGQIEFSFPTASASVGDSWSPTTVFAISYDGMVKMPLLPNGILVVNSTNVTSSNGVTASLFGTASQAVSASWAPFTQVEQVSASWASQSFSSSYSVTASWAPTSITYPLTTLPVNQVTYSIDFSTGQYFQVDTTGSADNLLAPFTFETTGRVPVRNASIYIVSQSQERTLVFNPSWVVLGNFPTIISASKSAILSLTSFGPNESDVVVAFGSQL